MTTPTTPNTPSTPNHASSNNLQSGSTNVVLPGGGLPPSNHHHSPAPPPPPNPERNALRNALIIAILSSTMTLVGVFGTGLLGLESAKQATVSAERTSCRVAVDTQVSAIRDKADSFYKALGSIVASGTEPNFNREQFSLRLGRAIESGYSLGISASKEFGDKTLTMTKLLRTSLQLKDNGEFESSEKEFEDAKDAWTKAYFEYISELEQKKTKC